MARGAEDGIRHGANVMQELRLSPPAIEDSEFSLGQIIVQAQVDVSVELR